MRLSTRREIATVGGKFTSNCACSGSPLNKARLKTARAHAKVPGEAGTHPKPRQGMA